MTSLFSQPYDYQLASFKLWLKKEFKDNIEKQACKKVIDISKDQILSIYVSVY